MKKGRDRMKVGTENTAAHNLNNSNTLEEESTLGQRNFYEQFRKMFNGLSNENLIRAFNREIGNPGWTSTRAAYLAALHWELKERGFDYSAIGNKTELSFAKKVKLVENKIVLIE